MKKKNTEETTPVPEFIGSRLRLARTLHGKTQQQLGEEIVLSPATISKMENGEQEPSSDQILDALCDVLGVDRSYFYRPIVDEFTRSDCSFRHVQSASLRQMDRAVAWGTLLQEMLHLLGQVAILPAVNIPDILAKTKEDAEEAAARCRNVWGLGGGPIKRTVRVAEARAGVVVVRLPGGTRKLDAFSRFGSPPVIVMNSDIDFASRERFTVIHELGELVIHRKPSGGDKESERLVDHYTSCFLMPRDGFSDDFLALPQRNWAGFFELKRRWRVSVKAVVYRANKLGLVGTAEFRRLMKHYHYKKWHTGEPYEPQVERPETFRLALEALEQENGGLIAAITQLGWNRGLAQRVLGVSLPEDLPDNVTQLRQA